MGTILTDVRKAFRAVRRAKASNFKVALTNGCFDTFHAGHLQTLRFAKRQGDVLIVAVNTDESVQALKGPHRPVYPLKDRMAILAELACVDYVVPFGTAADPSVEPLVKLLEPDVLVKGGDYTRETVVGGAVVEHHGGRVVIGPVVPGLSSTKTIEKLATESTERDPGPDLRSRADIPTDGARVSPPSTPWALVDLDGVLVDFFGAMAKALNLPWDPSDCRGEYDPAKMFKIPTDLFSLFGPDFWESCDWMPDAMALRGVLYRYFQEDHVLLCSSPTHESSSPMGKLRWIETHMPERWMRRYIFTPVKEVLARPDVILLDDCDANIDAFCAAGGKGILVPRPWNSMWNSRERENVPGYIERLIRGVTDNS